MTKKRLKWNDPIFKYKKTLRDENGNVLCQCKGDDKILVVPKDFHGIVLVPRGGKLREFNVSPGDTIIFNTKTK